MSKRLRGCLLGGDGDGLRGLFVVVSLLVFGLYCLGVSVAGATVRLSALSCSLRAQGCSLQSLTLFDSKGEISIK